MTVNDEEIELILLDAGEKMEGAVSHARREFSTVRTGRASSALFERLTVEAYGVEMKLQEMGAAGGNPNEPPRAQQQQAP